MRHLGDDSAGWRYYAAKFERDGGRDAHCIVVVDEDDEWVSGCGEGQLPNALGKGTTQITVSEAPLAEDETGERVGDHLLVRRPA